MQWKVNLSSLCSWTPGIACKAHRTLGPFTAHSTHANYYAINLTKLNPGSCWVVPQAILSCNIA